MVPYNVPFIWCWRYHREQSHGRLLTSCQRSWARTCIRRKIHWLCRVSVEMCRDMCREMCREMCFDGLKESKKWRKSLATKRCVVFFIAGSLLFQSWEMHDLWENAQAQSMNRGIIWKSEPCLPWPRLDTSPAAWHFGPRVSIQKSKLED